MAQPIDGGPERRAELRAKLMEHLEAAQALADETRDGAVGFYIESALDQLRADTWPGNLDVPPKRLGG
jgi:hypothetical protein